MVNQQIVDAIRDALIRDLEVTRAVRTQNGTRAWMHEEDCKKTIIHLRQKKRIKLGDVFKDHLNGVLHEHSIESNDPKHNEIWRQIEEGK